MNPFWHDGALDELADIWVAATPEERDKIEAAVKQMNDLLRRSPGDAGESRAGNQRVVFQGPLVVTFSTGGPVARVLHVRWNRRRP